MFLVFYNGFAPGEQPGMYCLFPVWGAYWVRATTFWSVAVIKV